MSRANSSDGTLSSAGELGAAGAATKRKTSTSSRPRYVHSLLLSHYTPYSHPPPLR